MTVIISIVSLERNRGKTTLIEQITKRFASKGLNVATIKHIHSSFDTARKDTWRHLQAGAVITVATTPTEIVTIKRSVNTVLQEALDSIPIKPELILVEGYKHSEIPKILCSDTFLNIQNAIDEIPNIVIITGSIICNIEQKMKLKVQYPEIEIYDFEELIKMLKKQIIKDIIDSLPGSNCRCCGYDECRDLAEAIIKGEAQKENCVGLTVNTTVLKVDNKIIPMGKFPQEVFRGIILGLLTSLKGVQDHPKHIEIQIRS